MTMNYHNRRLADLFRWRLTPRGEVGIEVEIEGGPWPEDPIPNWPTHPDHSLRNNGIEFVIAKPLARGHVYKHLEVLREHLADAKLEFSYRTSVHVHINVQDFTVKQWVNFIAAFTILEELLVDVVGPKRAGNKFCLRIKDAEEPIKLIRGGIQQQRLPDFLNGDLKYASMNVLATVTHGTLEFRAMEGNLDTKFINDWVQLLLSIKDYARNVESPRAIMASMSGQGPAEWAEAVLPRGNSITERVLASSDLRDQLYEGARLVQGLCFQFDWVKDPVPVEFPPVVYQEDAGLRPFMFFNPVDVPVPADWGRIEMPMPAENPFA